MDTFLINDTTIGSPQPDFMAMVNGIGRMFTPDQILLGMTNKLLHWLQEDTFPDSPNFGKLNKDIVAANYFDMTKNSPFDCIKQGVSHM